MGFLEDLFGRLSPQRPPVDVFGGVQPLDAFGDLMGDGSDALQPITPFGGLDRSFGGFSGGLGSTTSSSPAFWQMPALGGGIGTTRRGAFSEPLPIVKGDQPALPSRRAFSAKPAATTGTTTTGSTDTYGLPNVSADVTRWYPLAKKYADQEGVPVEAIMAIIQNESGGQPGARSGINPGDQGRAVGLMQLIPKYHGQDGADLTDPETNIQRGVRYFAQAYNKRGKNLDAAMAEYFGGGGAFDAAGNIRPDVGDINTTIGKYLPKFQATTAAYKTWLDRQNQAPAPATPQAAQGVQAAAIAEAQRHVGKPYLLAAQANNPAANAFDCSGLVQWSYKTAGVALPRTAQEQFNTTQRVRAEEVRPGDLVFFHSTYDAGTPVTHVGIAMGNGQMLQAGSGGVGVVDLNTPYWKQHLYGFGRVA
jgi:cell wall-associated NlpC family hydrolase